MNLATVAQVRRYMPQATPNLDKLIIDLLPRASDHIRRWLSRDLPVAVYTDKRLDGNGTPTMVLPDYPIISLDSLVITPGDPSLTISDGLTPGFVLDSALGIVHLIGKSFALGTMNIVASWTAGFRAEESHTIAATATKLTPTTGGAASQDVQVTYTANGAALAKVNADPGAGQYTFNSDEGQYTFSTSDNGNTVRARYYYVPSAINQVCAELVVLKIKQRDNLGVTSKSMGGESVSYDQKDMTPSMRAMLTPFKRMFPV